MRVIHRCLCVCSALFILMYIGVAVCRLGYPFDLEWMEGGMADHVRRVLEKQPLYVPPSTGFVPYVYPPLYYHVCALVVKLTGALGAGAGLNLLPPMRLVSFISSLVACALIFGLVIKETANRFAACLAAGVFVATYPLSGAYLDLARLDSLFLALVLAALYLLRRWEGAGGRMAAGLVLALAFLTKQIAVCIALPISVYCAYAGGLRRAVLFAGPFVAVAGGATLWLQVQSHGWYAYYVFSLPSQHMMYNGMLVRFWTADLLLPLGIAATFTSAFLFTDGARGRREARVFYALALAGLMLSAWFSRLHVGGFLNVLMPAYAALALGLGLGADALLKWSNLLPEERGRTAKAVIYLACGFQICALAYNPLRLVPTDADRVAGTEFLARLSEFPGDIWVTHHGQLSAKVGKASHAHWMAIEDVLRGDDGPVKAGLLASIESEFKSHGFSAVVCDEEPMYVARLLRKYYAGRVFDFDRDDVLWTCSGVVMRPSLLYLPQE